MIVINILFPLKVARFCKFGCIVPVQSAQSTSEDRIDFDVFSHLISHHLASSCTSASTQLDTERKAISKILQMHQYENI